MSHPRSVHIYFLADQFQGYLVRHVATNRASTQLESLETWVTPRDHFTLVSPPHPNNRLTHIQVRPVRARTTVVISFNNINSTSPVKQYFQHFLPYTSKLFMDLESAQTLFLFFRWVQIGILRSVFSGTGAVCWGLRVSQWPSSAGAEARAT